MGAGVGRYQLGQLTRPNVVALPSNLECTLNPSKKKKKPTHFSPVLFYKSLRKFHVASTSTKKSQERKTGQIARKY